MCRIFLVIFLLTSSLAFAGQLAITDTGDEVILNSDGTWEYKKEETHINKISKNETIFKKENNATFLLKSTKNNSAFYINPQEWGFKKINDSLEPAEYDFQLKGKDVYSRAITEEIPVGLEYLPNIALENALAVAPDAKIVKKEYRNVNGINVIHLEISGTTQGVEFIFLGYYYSDKSGTTQLVAWTSKNLVNKYRVKIIEFLNGFTIQQ